MIGSRAHESLARAYIRLLKDTLSNVHYRKIDDSPLSPGELRLAEEALEKVRAKFAPLAEAGAIPNSLDVSNTLKVFSPQLGAEWFRRNTWQSHTLLDPSGLDNVEFCVRSLIDRKIPGDLMECGVWRGGTSIFMRGLLKALGDTTRTVWVADSFQGLPDPDPTISPLDAISHEFLKIIGGFSVSLSAVQDNFRAYDLLDRQVRFLAGWFSDTLATAPVQNLALLRLDADYYESTMDALEPLYPKLSSGGFIIIDDYGIYNLGARLAVDEFRSRHDIRQPLVSVNECISYWEKA